MSARITSIALLLATSPLIGAVVTSGLVHVSPENTFFDLTGDGPAFHRQSTFSEAGTYWPGVHCYFCEPGTTVDASAFSDGSGLVGLGSSFRFTAAPVLITGPGEFAGTFVFSGSLCNVQITSMCVDILPLTGRGSFVIGVRQDPDALRITHATYTFAVPEPSTLLLAAPFFLFGLCHVRRKRTYGSSQAGWMK
jgi:hypothetical protein